MTHQTFFKDKRILVLGGTGSIGRVVVEQLQNCDPEVIRIYSRDETKQLQFKEDLAGDRPIQSRKQLAKEENIRFLVGDIREQERLERAMRGVDYVVQAAAMKRVDTCEYNPFEAVRTNVVGTENVIRAALRMDVKKVLGISTDKAINPPYVMGATKLLSEKLLSSVNRWTSQTVYSCVRFGNVLGSRGSVVPTIVEQVKKGGPVTLTDPDMSRFYVTPDQAGMLALEGLRRSKGGDVFFLTMPVIRTEDLLKAIVDVYAPEFGYEPGDIEMKNMGPRPGEKQHEQILSREEERRARILEQLSPDWLRSGSDESNLSTTGEEGFQPRLGRVMPLYKHQGLKSEEGISSQEEQDHEGIQSQLREGEVLNSKNAPSLGKRQIKTLLRKIKEDS